MFYKFKLAVWLPGPRAIFPGLPCAVSKVSFLRAKRDEGSSHLQADTAVMGILKAAGFGDASVSVRALQVSEGSSQNHEEVLLFGLEG